MCHGADGGSSAQPNIKILVILGHLRPGSFNHAIAETAIRTLEESGHTVCFHDLYQERFDPVLPYAEIPAGGRPEPLVATHCRDLAGAGGLVIVHPNWRHAPVGQGRHRHHGVGSGIAVRWIELHYVVFCPA